MRKLRNSVIAVLSAAVLPLGAASAQTVLTFEDLTSPTCCDPMPANYGGLTWDSNFGYYSSPQSPYTPHSGIVRIRTNQVATGNAEVQFQFATPSVFQGAWFAGLGATVQFNMYSGATLVGSSSTLATNSTSTFLASNYTGLVDKVGIVGDRGYYIFDDVTYDAAPMSAVPEPMTIALVGTGLAGLGLVARRRRTA